MIIVSDLLNAVYRTRLKSRSYRRQVFVKALQNRLRHSRLGHALLRNMNEGMTANPSWHDEFRELVGDKEYNEAFWESDLGFLWYQGNLNRQNEYFGYTINEIQKHGHQTHLDVGCGWGELTIRVSKLDGIQEAAGIDIAEKVIYKAKELAKGTNATFVHLDVLDCAEEFDLVTILGSTDYIPADIFEQVLRKLLSLAKKELIIVNSLRGVPFEEALALEASKQTFRYDIGCVHPINHCLIEWQSEYGYTVDIQKFGQDSTLTTVLL